MSSSDIPPILTGDRGGPAIKFLITRRDLVRCRLWVLAHSRFLLIFSFVVSVAVPLLNLGSPPVGSRSIGFKIFFVLLETAVVFCFLAVLNATVQVLFVLLRKNREALGNHELEIREDGLLERSDVGESLHRWAGFHKVCSTRRHLFIFVTENLVHYVPMRSFSSSQEASRFRDEIKRRADAARVR